MKNYFLFIFISFFISGCNYPNQPVQNNIKKKSSTPQWLTDSSYIKDRRNAVGCAGVHIKGKSEQKKLAISRAIEQIAMQKRTTVSTQTYRESSSNKLGKSETQSLQSTNNVNISTRVIDQYYDALNNKLCVLVVEE